MFDEVHKLLPRLGLVEGAGEIAGGGDRVLLLYAAHLHAHVLGFNDYHDAQRVECLLDALLNLKCHPFLHLQTVGEDIDYSGYLAEACDVAIGDVGYMSFAVEGEHVVLAKGKEVDVFYNNHLAIFFFEFGRP